MDKLSVIGKIGAILSDLKKQQEYFSNNLQTINEVEVELFAASANYLADYAKVLRKFPVERVATPMIPPDAAAKAVQQDDDDDIGFRLNIEEEQLVADDKKIHQVTEPNRRQAQEAAGESQAQADGSPAQAENLQAPGKPQMAAAHDAAPASPSHTSASPVSNRPPASDQSPTPNPKPGSSAAHRADLVADRPNTERKEKPPVSPEPVAPIADIPAYRQPVSPSDEKPVETEKQPLNTEQPSMFRREAVNLRAAQTPGRESSAEEPELRQPEPPQPEARQPELRQPEPPQPEARQPELRQPEPSQPESRQPEPRQPDAPTSPASDTPPGPEAPAPANNGEAAAQADQQRKVSLNERFSEKKATLYERIAPRQAQQQQQQPGAPIANLGRSIGINERYYFIKTLFQDDKVAFDQAITRIDICHSLGEALEYTNKSLAGKYHWNRKEEDARKFYDLLKRRFV